MEVKQNKAAWGPAIALPLIFAVLMPILFSVLPQLTPFDDLQQELGDIDRTALAPGGTLLLAEPMAGTPGAEAMADAYFGFYLLAMGRGRARRVESLFDLLRQAGFRHARLFPRRHRCSFRLSARPCQFELTNISVTSY
jgi:hypothetical protein